MKEESPRAGRAAWVLRLLRETGGALTAEWAVGTAVVLAVGAVALGGAQGSVIHSLARIAHAQASDASEDLTRLAESQQELLEKQKQLREQQERLERLRKEAEEAQERSAWEDFADWLAGDDGGAGGWDARDAVIKAERAWSGDDDD